VISIYKDKNTNKEVRKMTLTINQYRATVKKLNTEIKSQTNCWPYPQHRQSHIDFWTGEYTGHNHATVYLVNSDIKGALMRVKDGELTPIQLVERLTK
jgi:hypothetical protein